MVRLTRIYTKGGDKGKTSLGEGERVYKNSVRIEAIGQVDEANASVGWALQFCNADLSKILLHVQNDLFDIGADLCISGNTNQKLSLSLHQTAYLEKKIDFLNETLEPLTTFVLPGGTKVAAALHLARTIVRRAERHIIDLSLKSHINKEIMKYLNRLSDLLFVMARWANAQPSEQSSGILGDVLWEPGAYR